MEREALSIFRFSPNQGEAGEDFRYIELSDNLNLLLYPHERLALYEYLENKFRHEASKSTATICGEASAYVLIHFNIEVRHVPRITESLPELIKYKPGSAGSFQHRLLWFDMHDHKGRAKLLRIARFECINKYVWTK